MFSRFQAGFPDPVDELSKCPSFFLLCLDTGGIICRCDDLESLGYVIIAMMRGGSSPLPWSGTTSVAEGLKNKRATTLEDVCRGIPGPMLRYMNLVRGMAYEDTPEYDALDSLLQEIETSGEVSAMPPVPSRTRDGSGDQRRGAVGSNDESDAIRQVNPKGRGKGKGSTKTTTSAAAAQRPEHADESMRTRPRRGEAAKSGGKGIEEAGAASTEDVAEVIEVSDVMGEAAGKGRSVGSRRRAAKGAAASPKTRKVRCNIIASSCLDFLRPCVAPGGQASSDCHPLRCVRCPQCCSARSEARARWRA